MSEEETFSRLRRVEDMVMHDIYRAWLETCIPRYMSQLAFIIARDNLFERHGWTHSEYEQRFYGRK